MRVVVTSLLVLFVTLWAYQSLWTAGWVYEDTAMMFSATAPVSMLRARPITLWLWTWTSSSVVAAHALSLGLHLLVVGLVTVLLRRLGLTILGAGAAALLVLLHPLAAESVAYAAGRGELVVALGCLGACLCATGRWWRWPVLALLLACMAVAIGGKQAGVVVALLVPLAIWQARHSYPSRPWFAAWRVPCVVVTGLLASGVAWYGGLRAVVNVGTAQVSPATAVTWSQWLLAQTGAVGYWLLALVWPALLTPDADIDALSTLSRLMGLAALVAAAAVAWRVRARAPVVTFGLAWFLLSLLPRVIVQTPRSYLNAHQFYVPYLGLAFVAGWGVDAWRRSWMPVRS